MPDMKFLSKAALLDKTVVINGKPTKVLGLASFRTEPRGRGIGRHSLRAMEELAAQQGTWVMCFCLDDVLDFYLKCGWVKVGHGPTKHFLSSKPITGNVAVPEEF